jgi:hypothetical protein
MGELVRLARPSSNHMLITSLISAVHLEIIVQAIKLSTKMSNSQASGAILLNSYIGTPGKSLRHRVKGMKNLKM